MINTDEIKQAAKEARKLAIDIFGSEDSNYVLYLTKLILADETKNMQTAELEQKLKTLKIQLIKWIKADKPLSPIRRLQMAFDATHAEIETLLYKLEQEKVVWKDAKGKWHSN